jgi:hypothetical protein
MIFLHFQNAAPQKLKKEGDGTCHEKEKIERKIYKGETL